jgi:tRNA(fMet)-specific endonuclease VapC
VYVLETDILSIHQSEKGEEYRRVRPPLDRIDPTVVFVSIISLHEQAIGWHAYLQRAKKAKGLIRGYGKVERMLRDFTRLNILGFDEHAAREFDRLKSLGVSIGGMDLRITGRIPLRAGNFFATSQSKPKSKRHVARREFSTSVRRADLTPKANF